LFVEEKTRRGKRKNTPLLLLRVRGPKEAKVVGYLKVFKEGQRIASRPKLLGVRNLRECREKGAGKGETRKKVV